MKGAKKTQFHQTIKSMEQFQEDICNPNNDCCQIVDIHLEWCGPCKPMEQNYKTLWFSIIDRDPVGRLAFWQCLVDFVPPEVLEKIGEVTIVPKYIVFKNGQIKNIIDGAKYTQI